MKQAITETNAELPIPPNHAMHQTTFSLSNIEIYTRNYNLEDRDER